MYSYKIVEQVKRKKKKMSGALRMSMILFSVLFILMGIFFSRGFMLPGFLLVLLYFGYDYFSVREYEYILEGNNLDIFVIQGKRKRTEAHHLDLRNLEVVAPHWHESVAQYKKKGGSVRLPKFDYTSYEEETPYYTMIITEEERKIKLLLDLTEEMLHFMKKIYPQKVFFA